MNPKRSNFSNGFVWLLCELIIVFVGVMLAFLVNDWQAERAETDRAIRTLIILESELSDFATYGPIPLEGMQANLLAFDEATQAGEQPLPAYFRESRAPTPPMEAWKTVVQSGAYELLDDSLFYALSLHYNRVIYLSENFSRYTNQTEDLIMPYIDEPAGYFYEGGALKNRYRWHVRRLREIKEELGLLISEAGAIRSALQTQIKELE